MGGRKKLEEELNEHELVEDVDEYVEWIISEYEYQLDLAEINQN